LAGSFPANVAELDTRTIHISAGIHGDESAGCEAMITWTEKIGSSQGLALPPISVFESSHRAFTIETPSEFALETRVAAQVAIMEECIRRSVDEVGK